jgi:hypothetical protein
VIAQRKGVDEAVIRDRESGCGAGYGIAGGVLGHQAEKQVTQDVAFVLGRSEMGIERVGLGAVAAVERVRIVVCGPTPFAGTAECESRAAIGREKATGSNHSASAQPARVNRGHTLLRSPNNGLAGLAQAVTVPYHRSQMDDRA